MQYKLFQDTAQEYVATMFMVNQFSNRYCQLCVVIIIPSAIEEFTIHSKHWSYLINNM